jgi:anti-sigma regulatory factor (Ser/Thr protein kinase)
VTTARATVAVPRSIEVEARLERLSEVRAFVRSAVAAVGGSEDCIVDLVQAVDEAATNIVSHGYRGEPGPIEVDVRAGPPDGSVRVTILDRAPRFDPGSVAEPDLADPHIRPGGMGIHLMRAATDAVRHADRTGGGNVLTLVRTLGRRDKEA